MAGRARQCPFTAAITGLKISQPLSNELTVGRSQKVPGKLPAAAPGSARSAPAQNARPAPVTMPTQASVSSRKRAKAALISVRIPASMAFRASGRSYVMTATRPSRS
jgi:hypothetical protein